jgi:hypothetical protein
MTARAARLVLALSAAVAAGPVRAQWLTPPIVVQLEGSGRDVLAGTFHGTAAGQDDLLVVDQAGRTASLRPHHAPLTVRSSSFPVGSFQGRRAFRAGYLGPDVLADVASHYATAIPPLQSRIDVVSGDTPGAIEGLALPPTPYGGAVAGDPPYIPSFLRLLARPAGTDSIVMPYCFDASCSTLFVVDPASVTSVRSFVAPVLRYNGAGEAFPVWLSDAALDLGVDDIAVSNVGAVALWVQGSAVSELGGLSLEPILVGTLSGGSYVQGVASADVDGVTLGVRDGVPDLVFAMASPYSTTPGTLVSVWGSGNLADFGGPRGPRWHDLGAWLGLPDPVFVRPLRAGAGGAPAVAVWDRTLQRIFVLPASTSGSLSAWSAPAPGTWPRDIRLADVVGSGRADLVVVMDEGAGPTTVFVYPDADSAWPTLSWAPGSPGVAVRGVPLAVAVSVDPGGASSVHVDWIVGANGAPVGAGLSHVFPATCDADPPPFSVTVRATSETGMMSPDLVATVTWAHLVPSLGIAGAPGGRLVLPPGGTSVAFDAAVATSCGAASFGGTPWPAQATVADSAGPSWIRRTVTLPEAAYAALLADPAPVVTVATTDPAVAPQAASLVVPLDASGLVEVHEEADRTSLAAGDLAVLRISLKSRVGVTLPLVRVVGLLAGLEPAGHPTVTGATLVAEERGGRELVLSALPPAGAEVVIALPVRAVSGRSSAGAEARSSGGWALTPPGAAASLGSRPPGCGCGTGAGPGAAALALLALALRRRAPRAT